MAREVMPGMADLVAALRALGPEAEKAMRPAIYVAADRVRAHAQNSIVRGSISGKGHVPSNPGEPPNADTRHLDQSIHVEWVQPLTAAVVADAPHAIPLEYGTSTVAERPFMRPAAAAQTEASIELVARAVDKAMRKVAEVHGKKARVRVKAGSRRT